MRVLAPLSVLALSTVLATTAMAQAPQAAAAAPAKPVVRTTCADYVALDETIKPQFIYFAAGHGKNGKKDAVFEETAIARIKPELDQFCATHLTKSAYAKVIASSMASEPKHVVPHAVPR